MQLKNRWIDHRLILDCYMKMSRYSFLGNDIAMVNSKRIAANSFFRRFLLRASNLSQF